ncbi:MAG: hypothetical protein GY833_24730 [Aestuariibacter sp.]|nr:hypothetical protein [Aestuariibacter sp.]
MWPSISQAFAPANSQTADFDVTWSGSDATSVIVSYDVQYKDGDDPWTGWQIDASDTSATFRGQMWHPYHFHSRARDLTGHVEAWPAQPDASTSVGPKVTKYYYHGGKRVAMRQGGVVQYLHGDHPSTSPGQVLGSTSLAMDESGKEQQQRQRKWLQDRAFVERNQRVDAGRDGGSEWEQLYQQRPGVQHDLLLSRASLQHGRSFVLQQRIERQHLGLSVTAERAEQPERVGLDVGQCSTDVE